MRNRHEKAKSKSWRQEGAEMHTVAVSTMRSGEVVSDMTNEQSIPAVKMRGRSRHTARKRKKSRNKEQENNADVLHPQSEIQGNDRSTCLPSAKTPADEPNAKKSPPSCLRRRQKKARGRVDILNGQDDSEYDIAQRLDFTGCSSGENEENGDDLGKENSFNVADEPDKKTPPTAAKRMVSKSFEISATSKRKQVPKPTRKKLGAMPLKGKKASSTPGDQLNSPELAKVHIRNTCLLHSPADEPSQNTKNVRSGKRARNVSTDNVSVLRNIDMGLLCGL
ncbi:hypothetical protein FI667_g8852, partial [Globisporangium splendens]